MTDEIDDHWVRDILDSLAPGPRAKALRKIGTYVRSSNAARISRQVGPDDKKWAARKGARRGKMMKGLRLTRNLKTQSSANHVSVGWSGRTGRIARVHHYGLRDRVSKRGVRIKYERRELLGVNASDADAIGEIVDGLLDD